MSAIRFFYRVTLDRDWDEKRIPRYKDIRSLPAVLTKEEVTLLIDKASNLKYRSLFMLVYGSGLRLREAATLRVADIDSEKMQIRIQKGKGGKDRFAILPKTALVWLREYWKQYRPKDWLYEGGEYGNHIGGRAIQQAFQKVVEKAGFDRHITVHTLRHSFATHLLEAGVDVFSIKKMMGHADIKSTMVYLHIASITSLNIQSPLDQPANG